MADGKVVIDSTLNDRGVKRGIKDIKDRLRGLNKTLLKTAAIAALVSTAFNLLTSSVPVIAALAGGVMALGSAFASAGVGAIAFGALAVTALKGVFEATDETYKELSKAQQEAYLQLKEFKSFWKEFASEFEQPIANTFVIGLQSVQYMIEQMKPAFEGATKAMMSLTESFSVALRAKDVAEIFRYLNETAGAQLEALGKTVGYFFRGFMNMMVAFAPLGEQMTNGFLDMAKSFNDWAISLKSSDKFLEFVRYVQTNGPKTLALIGNLTDLIVALGVALAPIGAIALDVMNDLLSLFTVAINGDPIGPIILKLQESAPLLIQAGFNLFTSFIARMAEMAPMLAQLGWKLLGDIILGLQSAVPNLLISVTQIIQAFQMAFVTNFPIILQMGLNLLMTILSGIIQNLPLIINAVISIITTMVTSITAQLPRILQMGIQLLGKLILGIIQMLPQLVSTVLTLILNIINTIVTNLPMILNMGTKVLLKLIDGILKILPDLIRTIIKLVTKIVDTVLKNLPMIIDAGIEILFALIDGIVQILPELINAALDLIFAIVDTILDNLPQIIEAGAKILLALVKAIIDNLPELWSMIKDDLIGGIIDRLMDVDLTKIGKGIIKSLVKGLKSVNIPTPHFSFSGSLDLNPKGGMSIPKMSVDWYKDGGLFAPNSPRLVGMGDASVPEAALPLKPSVLGMIGRKIADTMPMPEGGNYQRQMPTSANISLVLGGTEYDVFVDDITEAQDRNKYRLKRK
jgi:phage-related protein